MEEDIKATLVGAEGKVQLPEKLYLPSSDSVNLPPAHSTPVGGRLQRLLPAGQRSLWISGF